jgi:two-component system, OmpR family, sensor histidine kinase KdpD
VKLSLIEVLKLYGYVPGRAFSHGWWRVTSAHTWEILGLILVAIIVGHLTSRASFFVRKSQANRLETEKLYEFTRDTSLLDLHQKPGPQLASLVRSMFDVEAVAIFDADLNEVYRVGEWFADAEAMVRNIYVFETVRDDHETGLIRRVLHIGNLPIGALLLRGETSKLTSNAIASLIAITFDRYHALAKEARIENARQAEQLRTTVLDSLAHAYKTPLTAIQAASTGLAEMGRLSAAQAGLVSLIGEQAELLNTLTTRLLKTARLEAHDLSLHSEPVAIAPLIDDVIASAREQLTSISVKVSLSSENISVFGDRSLLEAMLAQFVENAGKYASEGTTVTIGAAEESTAVVLSVHNLGSVIPPADREHVFDRYFRSSSPANKAPGTGIGLSIAKYAAEAHGGNVWVTSDAYHGTTFFASLPAAAPSQSGAPGGMPNS